MNIWEDGNNQEQKNIEIKAEEIITKYQEEFNKAFMDFVLYGECTMKVKEDDTEQ